MCMQMQGRTAFLARFILFLDSTCCALIDTICEMMVLDFESNWRYLVDAVLVRYGLLRSNRQRVQLQRLWMKLRGLIRNSNSIVSAHAYLNSTEDVIVCDSLAVRLGADIVRAGCQQPHQF